MESGEARFSMNPAGLRAWAAHIRAKADVEAKRLEAMADGLERGSRSTPLEDWEIPKA